MLAHVLFGDDVEYISDVGIFVNHPIYIAVPTLKQPRLFLDTKYMRMRLIDQSRGENEKIYESDLDEVSTVEDLTRIYEDFKFEYDPRH